MAETAHNYGVFRRKIWSRSSTSSVSFPLSTRCGRLAGNARPNQNRKDKRACRRQSSSCRSYIGTVWQTCPTSPGHVPHLLGSLVLLEAVVARSQVGGGPLRLLGRLVALLCLTCNTRDAPARDDEWQNKFVDSVETFSLLAVEGYTCHEQSEIKRQVRRAGYSTNRLRKSAMCTNGVGATCN